jgi:hypothetical protein
MKENGFIQLRRGLWEHVRNGSLNPTAALAYIYILSQADTRTGIWKGCAQSLVSALRIPLSTAKYTLQVLDHHYIHRFMVQGRRSCYPILCHKFLVSQGPEVGLRLDALSSTSERDLRFFPKDVSTDVLPEVAPEVGRQRIQETRDRRHKNKPREAKPASPADPRFQPFSDFAYKTYDVKHGRKPLWGGKDWSALKSLLNAHTEVVLSLDGLKTRWENYLASTEPFTVKKAGSLAHFCLNLDEFAAGPILATLGKGGTPNAEDRTFNRLRKAGLDIQ